MTNNNNDDETPRFIVPDGNDEPQEYPKDPYRGLNYPRDIPEINTAKRVYEIDPDTGKPFIDSFDQTDFYQGRLLTDFCAYLNTTDLGDKKLSLKELWQCFDEHTGKGGVRSESAADTIINRIQRNVRMP